MLKKTVLNDAHRALNARMVDFGGWDMPVNYGSQIEEHHAVRKDCGMFDVSHMCPVDLTGPDCRAFLSRLVANDVAKLTVLVVDHTEQRLALFSQAVRSLWPDGAAPACTLIPVPRLALDGMLIEIEATAVMQA